MSSINIVSVIREKGLESICAEMQSNQASFEQVFAAVEGIKAKLVLMQQDAAVDQGLNLLAFDEQEEEVPVIEPPVMSGEMKANEEYHLIPLIALMVLGGRATHDEMATVAHPWYKMDAFVDGNHNAVNGESLIPSGKMTRWQSHLGYAIGHLHRGDGNTIYPPSYEGWDGCIRRVPGEGHGGRWEITAHGKKMFYSLVEEATKSNLKKITPAALVEARKYLPPLAS